jgi:hypothetical protein
MNTKNNNFFLAFLILFGSTIIYSCGESHAKKEENAYQLVVELDKLESEIILGIENKASKEDLLYLIDQLQHPSSLYIKGKKYGIIENKWQMPDDEFHGHFNEYYSELRTAYKYIVVNNLSVKDRLFELDKKNKKTNQKKNKISAQKQDKGTEGQDKSISGNSEQLGESSKKNIDQLKRFVGLYVKQSGDGGVYMYKLSQRESEFEMIYQDNVTGNVVIENFIVTSFITKTNTINLKSLNDGRFLKLKFKNRINETHVHDMVDENNNLYEFMPN